LLNLTSSLSAALQAGATVVVPSRQRAAAVRLAVAAAALRSGLGVWRSPDVLPWQGWLSREFEALRPELGGERRLLRATESWFIWRGIAATLAEEHGLLAAGGLAAALPRSLAYARDWGLRWSGDAGPEAELLRAAESLWRRSCEALRAIDPGDWPALPGRPDSRPAVAPVLAGFAWMGAARDAWLAGRGALPLPAASPSSTPAMAHAAADPGEELSAAAAWCRARLGSDPGARLLVVVPGLDHVRARVLRSFGAALDGAWPDAAGPTAFALEGGQPLADFPLVRAALALLAFGVRPLEFAEFSLLLRTPYLALGPPDAAWRLELWLRDRNLTSLDAAGLRALLPLATRELGPPAGALGQRLLDCLLASAAAEPTGGWARRYVAQLQTAGWPGSAPLGSEELQVRRRFEELLGDYAASGTALARRDAPAALQLLAALARDSAFEPASDDVPVTISARGDDPVVAYDGIWVCGCDAARWPAPPAPDAFIPLSAQLAAGVPRASAEGQLLLARRLLAAWRASTPELILSWARSEEDAEQSPSGLLAGCLPWRPAAEWTPRPTLAAAPLEALADHSGPRWSRGTRIAGGVRALEWQAECPFRAFAQLRLAALPVPEPAAGVDPRLRGRILHRALDTLWRELGDSQALQALSPGAQALRVAAAVAAAMASELAATGAELPALLRGAEQRRAAVVVGMLLDAERGRAPFRVIATEAQRPLELGALALGLRLDRVDELADGSMAILDYKSGRAESFDPHAERLRRPQLPGYALAWGAGAGVAAVATVHLRRDGVKWRGAADADGRLPQLRAAVGAPEEWPALQRRWRERLGALLQELADGAAGVTPLARACEHCHLAALCRVDARRTSADEGGAERDEADGG
jgi:probable DNA repair protein